MIKLLVDESYAFDYLSILEVKLSKLNNKKEILVSVENCLKNLKDEMSENTFKKVYKSEEYGTLLKVNEKLFDAVDLAKKNEVTAKYVDDLVYERYLAKKSLQKEFFNNNISEIKVGYDK